MKGICLDDEALAMLAGASISNSKQSAALLDRTRMYLVLFYMVNHMRALHPLATPSVIRFRFDFIICGMVICGN